MFDKTRVNGYNIRKYRFWFSDKDVCQADIVVLEICRNRQSFALKRGNHEETAQIFI